MNESTEKDLLNLLNQKRNLLTNMLTITQAVRFTDSDDDAEKYVKLIDERQVFMDEILDIDSKIEEKSKLVSFSDSYEEEASFINNNIKAVTVQILELDEKNKLSSSRIMDRLQSNMKSLKKGRAFSNLYTDKSIAQDGYYFDKKK